jgi:hypothetical protein
MGRNKSSVGEYFRVVDSMTPIHIQITYTVNRSNMNNIYNVVWEHFRYMSLIKHTHKSILYLPLCEPKENTAAYLGFVSNSLSTLIEESNITSA